jgi:ubiquinone/menaquinone biosynthesis C-methylase UbiE
VVRVRTKDTTVREHFEGFAGHYQREAFEAGAGLRHVSEGELSIVGRRLGRVTGRDVLDVGIGTGRFARMLVGRGANVVGMDFSNEMLSECARNEPRVRLVHGRLGARLPFPDAAFDDVVCIRVIKYVPDWDAALSEIRRVMRPGGRLMLEIANRRSVARWGYPSLPVRSETIGRTRSLLRAAGFIPRASDAGTRLPFAVYRWARTDARLRWVLRAERALSAALGRAALARSVLLTCEADERRLPAPLAS